MGYPDDLIEQARALASLDRRKPKQANLRRAVSAAYYALFHEVTVRTANSMLSGLVGGGPVGIRLRRVVQHNSALKAAKWLASKPSSMPVAIQEMRVAAGGVQTAVSPALVQVCVLFIDLQEERHRADYDFGSPFNRAETDRLINDAEAAITSLRGLDTKDDVLIFLLGCALGDALARNV